MSTWHRVRSVSGNVRHSIPFFCNLDYDAIVDPAQSVCQGKLKDKVGEAKYKETCAGDYICQKLGLMYDNIGGVASGSSSSSSSSAAAN